jgi:hypothetical protein
MDTLKGKTTLLVVLLVCAFLSEGVRGKYIDYKDFTRCAGRVDHEGKCKPVDPLPIEKGAVNPYQRGCSPITGCRS